MATVFVAGSASCTSLVVQGIARYDGLCNGQSKVGSGVSEHASGALPVTVDLHAKYYDAAVTFVPCRNSDGWKVQLHAADAESPVEGLIFATDGDVMGDAIKVLLADAAGASSRLHIKLLVHVQWGGAAELADAERLAWTEWCLDNGFELIEVVAADPVRGWRDREKEGLPRLIEALHSTMWSTMVRRDQPATVFARAEAVAASATVAATGPASSSASFSSSLFAAEKTDNAAAAVDAPLNVRVVASADAITIEEEEEEPDDEDALMAQLEEVIGQAREYRQQAVDGAVPDEERLRRAEHVARALATMLHLDDDDNDDDDDDEGNDDDDDNGLRPANARPR